MKLEVCGYVSLPIIPINVIGRVQSGSSILANLKLISWCISSISLFASCLFAGGCWTASFSACFSATADTAFDKEETNQPIWLGRSTSLSAISDLEGEIKGYRQRIFARSQRCGATQKLLNKKSQVAKVEVLWRLEAAASCSCHSGDLLNLSRSIPTYANMTCTELHETFTGFLLVESAQRVR